MKGILNIDSPFMQGLSKIADLMIVNILFILCSVPLVTIGASATALYAVTLKMAKNEETYICRDFFKSFKTNFRQSTLIFLGSLLLGICLALNLRFTFGGIAVKAGPAKVLMVFTGSLFLLIIQYIFPYVARFQDKTKMALKNCILIAIANLPRSLCMGTLVIASILVSIMNTRCFWFALLIWTLIGFSGIAYINSGMLRKIFVKYESKAQQPDKILED